MEHVTESILLPISHLDLIIDFPSVYPPSIHPSIYLRRVTT